MNRKGNAVLGCITRTVLSESRKVVQYCHWCDCTAFSFGLHVEKLENVQKELYKLLEVWKTHTEGAQTL